MKKIVIAVAVLALLLCSCASAPGTPDKESADSISVESDRSVEELRETYPEYFELYAFKGIEVYVCKTEDGQIRCGMMSGTNRNKGYVEIRALEQKPLSVSEAKAILSEIGVDKDEVFVYPVSQPCSYDSSVTDEFREEARALFE